MLDKEAIQELALSQAITAANDAVISRNLLALPATFSVHDVEKHLEHRIRMRGSMTTSDVTAFAAYADANKQDGAAVFVDAAAMSATAVLNLGNPEAPGHCDNTATFKAKATAAYTALTKIATGHAASQQVVAEFLEDWAPMVECQRDGETITTAQAIAAVRKITIENLRKQMSERQQLAAERSEFERIEAKSDDPLPTLIEFKTEPYLGLPSRTFGLRLGIITGEKAPSITLRIINAEQHAEDMAAELAALVSDAIGDAMDVLVGTYKP